MQSPQPKKIIRITTVPISLHTLLKGQLQFMNEHYSIIGVSSSGALLDEVRQRERIVTHAVEMTRLISPLKDIGSLWYMYRFLKQEKPFIVHSHTPKAGIIGMLAAKLAGVPFRLHTVAGLPLLEATGIKRKILNWVEKITYTCATKVYPNSNGLKEIILQEKFCSTAKIKVIGNGSSNGIDTGYFSSQSVSENTKEVLKKQLGVSSTDFVFVFVGRLVSDKGINELIKAFTLLCSKVSNVKLLLVGPLETELDPLSSETITTINNNRHIITVGYQSDVRPYFAISNALVFPSYREGFPNVVMQAGAMGLPSIVTQINGCNEIIVEGKNGTLIPVKDHQALYKAMLKMKEDQVWRNGLESNARTFITSRYEQKIVWEALLAEYKALENV